MKDFFQYASPTRVIAGRDLLESTGFEFKKEGARRVFVVTDPVVRGTGLVERVEAGVADGGLELAGVYDDVPQDSSTAVVERCAAAAKEAGRKRPLTNEKALAVGLHHPVERAPAGVARPPLEHLASAVRLHQDRLSR